MADKELLEQIADKDCECVDNKEGIRCKACKACMACMAASALNLCSEIMDEALKEINDGTS